MSAKRVLTPKEKGKLIDAKAKEAEHRIKLAGMLNREYYSLRSLMGYSWAMFYFLLGGREAGKSFAVSRFYVKQFMVDHRPFYWLRLTEASQRKLLANNAEKLIDPSIRRAWGIDLETAGDGVYLVEKREAKTQKVLKKKLMCRVLALSTFYNDKGSGLFDETFLSDKGMYYNICLDEMNREKCEKNSFDIVYAFTNQLENLIRSTKQRVRIICIGNTLQEASDILCAFDFVPENFGRYPLKSKRAVIEYIEPTQKYLQRRVGTVADILMPTASTFTNKIETDKSLVTNTRLIKPSAVICFRKDAKYTVWDSNTLAPYNGEKCRDFIAMRPYLDLPFDVERRDTVISLFDTRCFQFKNLITFKKFQHELELLKPRK